MRDMPENLKHMYESSEIFWYLDEYEKEMDNSQAMNFLLSHMGITKQEILLDEGSQVYLYITGEKEVLKIDASGRGTPYNHVFEVTRISYADWEKLAS